MKGTWSAEVFCTIFALYKDPNIWSILRFERDSETTRDLYKKDIYTLIRLIYVIKISQLHRLQALTHY